MRKIAVANLKGRTGKTSTVVNLAAALAIAGKRVLVLDADLKGYISPAFGLGKPKPGQSLYQLLIEDRVWTECIVSARDRIDVLPADHTLAVAEELLHAMPRREEILAERLGSLEGYDFVLVDCAASLSLLLENVLLFSDEVLLPVAMDHLAVQGAEMVLENLELLRTHFRRAPSPLGVVPTLVDEKTNGTRAVKPLLAPRFGHICPILPAIPLDTKVNSAFLKRRSIFEHAETAPAAAAYEALAKALLETASGTITTTTTTARPTTARTTRKGAIAAG